MSKVAFQEAEETLVNFIPVLLTTILSWGHTLAHAPHKTQYSWLNLETPSSSTIALHAQRSTQEPQPTHSASVVVISPSNGLVTSAASTGQISLHQPQLIQSDPINMSPVILGFSI